MKSANGSPIRESSKEDAQQTFWDMTPELENGENPSATSLPQMDASPERDLIFSYTTNPWLENEQTDDLTRLLGIDSEIRDVLSSAGVDNFAKLTQMSVANLRSILNNAGSDFEFVDPGTWPEQAIYASQGNWKLHNHWRSTNYNWSGQTKHVDELELLEQANSLLAGSPSNQQNDGRLEKQPQDA